MRCAHADVNECKNSIIGKSCEYPATQGNCTPVTCWHCGGRDFPGWIKGKLPEGLDLISIDSYELGNISRANKTVGHTYAGYPWWQAEPLENKQFYQQFLAPKLWPHQRMMVVPGFYGNNTATAAEAALQDERLVEKLDIYWEWVKSDPLMVGMNPYHWGDSSGREGPNCSNVRGGCLSMCCEEYPTHHSSCTSCYYQKVLHADF